MIPPVHPTLVREAVTCPEALSRGNADHQTAVLPASSLGHLTAPASSSDASRPAGGHLSSTSRPDAEDMVTVPSVMDLDAVNQQAANLLEQGHIAAAASTVRRSLALLNAKTAWLDEQLHTTAALYLRSLPGHDTDHDMAVAWARYAARASRRRYGPAHANTAGALRHLLWVLCPTCTTTRAASVSLTGTWTRLLESVTAVHGRHAVTTLRCRYQRAMALHHLGRCELGTAEIKRSWQLWLTHHGTADITILRELTTMLHDCPTTDDDTHTWLRLQRLAVPVNHPTHQAADARTATHCTTCTYLRPGSVCLPPAAGAITGPPQPSPDDPYARRPKARGGNR